MIIKRIISLTIVLLIIISSAALSVNAAGEGVEPTVNPTEAPTEPRPSPAKLGYAAYAAELDKTVTKDELGAIYSKASTTFRLWTPVATDVRVCIYKTGSDYEQGAQRISATPMKFSKSTGLWSATVSGDYKNHYYTYMVTVDGVTNEVVDPYAKAVGVNGNRGMIVDLAETDPEGWDEDSFARVAYATDAVVWEVSVKDFSASEDSGVSEQNRGKYLAFTEPGTSLNGEGSVATCIAYLRRLGVNYVQINPFYDFASIDESDTETPQYNWGYDPKNYNVPEGSYSSDPYDGRVRIKECKQMIQALHEAGIGVIMDVVYNHTYYSEDSFFNQIVPYYYHRINEDGSWSNGSGCGNDVATERTMVRRFIRDSVRYWAQEYHIDGFRFDLMGLMDVDTMNNIRVSLDSLPDGDRIIMYGEAWNLTTTVPANVKLANQGNMALLSKRIGAFNDTARDAIKGSVFIATETGFVQEGKSKGGVRSAIEGDGGGWASMPNQCVNYSACHDNLALYDKLTDSVYGDKGYELRREDLVAMNKLSAAIIMMSRGMPFMHAGEEMGRTKLGDENSYKSDISVNQITWSNLNKYASTADYYRGLIKLRSALKVFGDQTGTKTELSYLEPNGKGCIAYTIDCPGYTTVTVAFNGSPTDEAEVPLPEGKWVILADADRAGTVKLGEAEGTLTVAPTSAMVLVTADSYSYIKGEGDEAVIYARYFNDSGVTIYEQRVSGNIGSEYTIYTPDDILFHYNISDDRSELHGFFEDACKIVTVQCHEYEGGFSSVTFKFVDADGKPLYDSIVMTNRVGQQYFSPAIPIIPGYRLNLTVLPDNGAGLYTEEPIEVVYRFKVDSGEQVSANDENTCRANVIYMGNSGEILEVKSYLGKENDMLEIESIGFGGYDYVSLSDNYASFSRSEINVLVNYMKKESNIWIYFVIGGAVVLLIAIASFFAGRKVKRNMKSAMDIEE